VRLLGDRKLTELAEAYLQEASERLRPGSYKGVRFAIRLAVSEIGELALREITEDHGRQILALIAQLTPNVRKYREARGAGLSRLAKLSRTLNEPPIAAQTQARIWRHMCELLEWCVEAGELIENPWTSLSVRARPEVMPHASLTDDEVVALLGAASGRFWVLIHLCLLSGLRSGEAVGLTQDDLIDKGSLGTFVRVRPNAVRPLKTRAAEREVPMHRSLEGGLGVGRPQPGNRVFPSWTTDRVVKQFARLRQETGLERPGLVFHSTRKWFITQCERSGVPENFTASLVGHASARSANRLTYGIYSAGISDAQKREIVDRLRLPGGCAS